MKTLIKKDIKIVGAFANFLIISFGFMFGFLIVLIEDHFIRILLHSITIFLMIGAALFKMWGHDFSKRTDIFLNSLPLGKEIIVASRYASVSLYVIGSSLFVFIISHSYRGVFTGDVIYPINVNELINIISISIFIMVCYLPMWYAKGKKILTSSNTAIFITIATISILRSSDNTKSILYSMIRNIDLSRVSFLLIILNIIAYIVSLKTSIKLYKSQEF